MRLFVGAVVGKKNRARGGEVGQYAPPFVKSLVFSGRPLARCSNGIVLQQSYSHFMNETPKEARAPSVSGKRIFMSSRSHSHALSLLNDWHFTTRFFKRKENAKLQREDTPGRKETSRMGCCVDNKLSREPAHQHHHSPPERP